jgi:hypothetical protein
MTRIRPSLWQPSPSFYAWCDEANRADAFGAALSAFVGGGKLDLVTSWPPEFYGITPEEAIAALRIYFPRNPYNSASFRVALRSGRVLEFGSYCHNEASEQMRATGPLGMGPCENSEMLPRRLTLASIHGPRSAEVETAIAGMLLQPDVEDLLLRFCTSPHITTGGYAELPGWKAPVEMAGTYHADAAAVARDLALSWVHLHEGEPVERASRLSIDDLRAHVESAPAGARIPIATDAHRLAEQNWGRHQKTDPTQRRLRPQRPKRVARPGDDEISREQILAALSTPPATLLEALEAAAAAPDDEWRAVEPFARETMDATRLGVPTYEADVTTREHVRFLQEHAPYHVRRLPNGGVMLATHPFRILWPLWADALSLLGITG